MLKKIPAHILRQAAERYGLTARSLNLLSSSESGNTVYQYQVGTQEFVLKLIPHANKDKSFVKNLLESELELVNYLANNGVSTPKAVISKGGDYIELIDLEGSAFFSAVSLEKARGREITGSDFGAELFTEMGRLTGRIVYFTSSSFCFLSIFKVRVWLLMKFGYNINIEKIRVKIGHDIRYNS
jgi:Ser/Thr protein kinase RdoA (MazF antagonist)